MHHPQFASPVRARKSQFTGSSRYLMVIAGVAGTGGALEQA